MIEINKDYVVCKGEEVYGRNPDYVGRLVLFKVNHKKKKIGIYNTMEDIHKYLESIEVSSHHTTNNN